MKNVKCTVRCIFTSCIREQEKNLIIVDHTCMMQRYVVHQISLFGIPERFPSYNLGRIRWKSQFIRCNGAIKAVGAVLGFQCETFNFVCWFRNSKPTFYVTAIDANTMHRKSENAEFSLLECYEWDIYSNRACWQHDELASTGTDLPATVCWKWPKILSLYSVSCSNLCTSITRRCNFFPFNKLTVLRSSSVS